MTLSTINLNEQRWQELAEAAWKCRDNACVIGNTKVGAAVLSNGKVFVGCNVEHKFRSHDIHAEVNAISNMISAGAKKIEAIMIVAEREKFTPCGACLDWIFEFGGAECLVGHQSTRKGPITVFKAGELMPHYPK
jgi:cytidine deaminase